MPANKALVSDMKAKCYEYYKDFKSIMFTADKTGYDPKTVRGYYKEFGRLTLEQDKEKFIEAQKITKDKVIYKLETMIERGEKQLKRLEQMNGITEEEEESGLFQSDLDEGSVIKIESLINKVQGDLINWNQQKAVIEDSPTLDIKIDDLVEDRLRELDEREQILNKKETEMNKKEQE